MKKYFFIWLIIAFIIAALFLVIKKYNQASLNAVNNIAFSDTSKVSTVEIMIGDENIILKRLKNDWVLENQINVDKIKINDFFNVLSRMNVESIIPAEFTDSLMNKAMVRLCHRQKKMKDYIFFKSDLYPGKTLLKFNSKELFMVHTPGIYKSIYSYLHTSVDFWRDKTIVRLTSFDIHEVLIINHISNESYTLNLNPSNPSLILLDSDSIYTDLSKTSLSLFLAGFNNIQAVGFIGDQNKLDSLRNTNPDYEIRIRHHEKNELALSIYPIFKNNSRNYDICYCILNKEELALLKYVEIDPVIMDCRFFLR
ncbi:hypothetical protein ACFLSA_00045 [Bacteroidota bacterium]